MRSIFFLLLTLTNVQANISAQPLGIIEIRCEGVPFYWVLRDKYGISGCAYRVREDVFMISLTNPVIKVIKICD